MGVSEALSEGLEVVVIGLIIVFSVLLILMLVLMLMKAVFYREPKPEKNETALPETPVSESAADKAKAGDEINDSELVAVLAAAVAASLNTSTYNLNIKSFRRIKDNSPSWNKAGRTDVINSRFN